MNKNEFTAGDPPQVPPESLHLGIDLLTTTCIKVGLFLREGKSGLLLRIWEDKERGRVRE